MGFDNMAEFKSSLDDIRASVKRLFEHSLPPLPASTGDKDPWHVRWQIARYGDRKGFDDPPGPSPLTDFIKRMTRLSLSQRASKRLDEFMPQLLEKVDGRKLDDAEFSRVLDLISAICRRSAYLSLLVQNPGATDRMLELFVASEQIAGVVTRYPALLDELIDPSLGAHLPTDDDLDAGVQRILNAHADTETTLQNLNYFKKAVDLRVAVAIFKSSMRVFEAQSLLSHLAECLIQAVLTLSTQEVADRHGPLNGPGLAVIAYGSLGSRALRFDSDLDLIFLYQRTEEHSTGPRSVPAEGFHTRVARRLLNLLSAITPSGRLYNIDARLRPNGRSGLLVSSVEAFARYQLEQAWVWELQALTRARPVAGSAKIGRLFGEARHNSLTAVRDLDLIRREVPAMRVRLRKEHHEGDALKHAPGGLLDIEFLVQYGVLLNAHRFTSLIDSTVTIRQMRSLGDTGWLGHRACSALEKAYTLLNQVRLTTLLSDIDSGVDPDTLLDIARPFCAEYW
jgi:glutamate-ammonia-ligase adenylyltransferase